MKKLVVALCALLLLAGCGNTGTQTAGEDFIAGNGATSYIAPKDRVAAPKLAGMTLLGTTYSLPSNQMAVINVWASWLSLIHI